MEPATAITRLAELVAEHPKGAAPWAALAGGAATHSFELDDYTLIAHDHPSAVLVPARWRRPRQRRQPTQVRTCWRPA